MAPHVIFAGSVIDLINQDSDAEASGAAKAPPLRFLQAGTRDSHIIRIVAQRISDGADASGLGDSYYAFGLAKPGAEDQFADAEQSIPSILYWLSASPDPAQRWNPIDPALNMLRPAPVDVPEWADAHYVRHTIDAFRQTGFRGGLNYYTAFPKTFELMAAYKDAVIRQPSLYIWGAVDGLSTMLHPVTPSLEALREAQPNLVGQIRLANVGHWVQNEAPDQVNEALTTFLAGI